MGLIPLPRWVWGSSLNPKGPWVLYSRIILVGYGGVLEHCWGYSAVRGYPAIKGYPNTKRDRPEQVPFQSPKFVPFFKLYPSPKKFLLKFFLNNFIAFLFVSQRLKRVVTLLSSHYRHSI